MSADKRTWVKESQRGFMLMTTSTRVKVVLRPPVVRWSMSFSEDETQWHIR
jgi:hypothetical protein